MASLSIFINERMINHETLHAFITANDDFCVACTSTKDKNNKRLESEENHPIDSMNSSIEIIADRLQTPWSIQKVVMSFI